MTCRRLIGNIPSLETDTELPVEQAASEASGMRHLIMNRE